METKLPLDSELPNEQLALNSDIRTFLQETAKWAFFISIIGFIYVGIMVLAGIVMGFASSFLPDTGNIMPFPIGFIGIFYALLGLITLIPFFYLFRFSTNMKTALRNNSEASLTHSFSNLKSHYKFYGIFMIIILVIYLLILVGSLFMGFAF